MASTVSGRTSPQRISTVCGRTSTDKFNKLVWANKGLIESVVRNTTKNPQDREDAVQNALIKAWVSIDRLEEETVCGWLTKTAYSAAVDLWRRKQARPDFSTDDYAVEDLCSCQDDTLQAMIRGEDLDHAKELIDKLPPKLKRIAELDLNGVPKSYILSSEKIGCGALNWRRSSLNEMLRTIKSVEELKGRLNE